MCSISLVSFPHPSGTINVKPLVLFFSCSHSDSKKRFKIAQNNKNIRSYVYSIYVYIFLADFFFCSVFFYIDCSFLFLLRYGATKNSMSSKHMRTNSKMCYSLLYSVFSTDCDLRTAKNEDSCVNAVSFSKIVKASFKPSISCSRRFLRSS